ncbi:MAG: flagellar biosynthetic protein FliR [Nitrospinota bacterium]
MPLLENFLQVTLPQFETYLLILVRVGFIFVSAPVFGSRVIPRVLKAAMVAVVALAVYPAVAPADRPRSRASGRCCRRSWARRRWA